MGEFFNQESQTSMRQMLRNRMTHAEKVLWYYLRKKSVAGFRFRRQFGIGPYVTDFYCPTARLVVEVDGDSHYKAVAGTHDTVRQRFIEQQGISVIRFTDSDVLESLPAVIEKIEKSLTPSNSPLKRGRNRQTPSNSPFTRGRKEKSISSPCQGEVRRGPSVRGL